MTAPQPPDLCICERVIGPGDPRVDVTIDLPVPGGRLRRHRTFCGPRHAADYLAHPAQHEGPPTASTAPANDAPGRPGLRLVR